MTHTHFLFSFCFSGCFFPLLPVLLYRVILHSLVFKCQHSWSSIPGPLLIPPYFQVRSLGISFWKKCLQFSSVQFSCLVVSNPERPYGLQHARLLCSSPTPGAYLKLMSIELVMPSNHLILCHPLLLLPSIFPSIKVFSNESVLHIRWLKYWSFSFSIFPMNIQD